MKGTKEIRYRIKMSEYQICVLINLLYDYRKKHSLSIDLDNLILKSINALDNIH